MNKSLKHSGELYLTVHSVVDVVDLDVKLQSARPPGRMIHTRD